MASFTTGLTGWVDRSRSSVFLISFIGCVGIFGKLIFGVRVCLTITIIIVAIVGTAGVLPGLLFFSLELTVLVPIVTWFFAMVANWFGLFRVLLCSLLVTVFICNSSGASKPFSSNSFSISDTICSYVPFSNFASIIDFFKCGAFWHICNFR